MKSLLTWLDHKMPRGIYATFGRSVVAWCDSKLSVNAHLYRYVSRKLGLGVDAKSPPWFSEIYQLLWIAAECGLLYLSLSPASWVARTAAAVALYRSLEVVLFAVGWVFIHTSHIHSYRRSLSGFLLNVGEVVVCFATASLGFRCVPTESVWAVLYSSLRTTATIGPVSPLEPSGAGCYALVIAQIAVSYFLAAVVLAGVVGSLRRREEYPRS